MCCGKWRRELCNLLAYHLFLAFIQFFATKALSNGTDSLEANASGSSIEDLPKATWSISHKQSDVLMPKGGPF